jgi:hypothetical protein
MLKFGTLLLVWASSLDAFRSPAGRLSRPLQRQTANYHHMQMCAGSGSALRRGGGNILKVVADAAGDDGLVELSELLHVPLLTAHVDGISSSVGSFSSASKLIWPQIKAMFAIDKRIITFIALFCVGHKYIMRFLYRATHLSLFKKDTTPTKAYEETFLG